MSNEVHTGKDANGTAYDFIGPADAPALALVHGLGLCRHLWEQHIPSLREHFRVINYDLYGHGDSAALTETASLAVYAKQLADLLDYLSIEKTHIVGFSIGGMINRRFAIDYPNKLNAMVILNSPHNRGESAQQQVEARAAAVREQGAMATMDDALKRWFTPDYLAEANGPALVKQWRNQVDPESYAQAAWVLANGVRELIEPTPPITSPTLVITGENDTGSTPAMCHAIATEIAGAKSLIVPKLQHLGLMEDPAAFTLPINEFLQGLNT